MAAIARFATAVLVAAAACGDGQECEPGLQADGTYTLASEGMCVRDVVTRARRSGAWAGGENAPAIEWQETEDGGLRVVLVAEGPAEGLEMVLPAVGVNRMLQQGYQSWSFTGTVQIPRSVPLDDDGEPLMEAARTGDPVHEARGVSFYATLFRRGEAGPVLIAAALRAEVAVTGISAVYRDEQSSDITILYGPQRELLPSGNGGVTRSEEIYLGIASTPEEAMERIRAQLQVIHDGSGVDPRRPPAGWFSWNQHFADIDEALIDAHIDLAGIELIPHGMTLIEIDDGWSLAWGDWRANSSFPSGMEAIAAKITGGGLVAGIWLAPFLVDVESEAAQLDPGLFVEGTDGSPLVHRISGNPRSFYVLDGSNPDSMAIATDEIERLAGAGFTFFKLDFLYAGALAGGRQEAVTGIQALRQGLASIREAAGDAAAINACGSPTLPVIGLADSLRVGPDTAFDGFDLTWGTIAAAARNLANRHHLFPLLWLDADQTQVREPYSMDEARAGAIVAALAGPAYSLGDDLTTLDADRLAIVLDETVLDIAGAARPGAPIGLMDSAADEIASTPIIESFRFPEGYVVPPPPRFEVTGASGTAYVVAIDWPDAHAASVESR